MTSQRVTRRKSSFAHRTLVRGVHLTLSVDFSQMASQLAWKLVAFGALVARQCFVFIVALALAHTDAVSRRVFVAS